ncbi:2-hydroxyacid dehydrogenase [Falsiroseomonas sp. HW251]|uniref:2-hydroxyacid dehydrogenase n=1 Tax=Falsiroseomonas sp. HW251 TaxID=3390998 RepID=UPI003D30FD80
MPSDAAVPMRVAFVGAFASRLAELVRPLLAASCEAIAGDVPEILPRLVDVDVIVSMVFTPEMAAAAPRLRLVQVAGAGTDRVDRAALRPGVLLANAFGHEDGIADHAIGAMIALSRDFARLDAALRQGRWESQWKVGAPAPPLWPELGGRTLGLLGFGHIGEAVARRAAAFGMRIVAIGRRARPAPPGIAWIGGPERLEEMLREADHLVVSVPLDDATRGLLDARRLGLMKPGAILVNVARGEVVDEAALYEALKHRRLAAAALDVWYRYPAAPGATMPATLPFHELPNVLMTPHSSGWTEGMLTGRARTVAENIARLARGEPPLNAIG